MSFNFSPYKASSNNWNVNDLILKLTQSNYKFDSKSVV